MNIEQQYLNHMADIMHTGIVKEDRTGTGTKSKFGLQMRHDMRTGFPLLTSKKVNFEAIKHELLWFLSGCTDVTYLQENNVKIWNEWVGDDNTIGPLYGSAWRDFHGVDQIEWLMKELRQNPDSRRLIVSAWNPSVLPDTDYSPSENVNMGNAALAPCHTMFQFFTHRIPLKDRLQMLLSVTMEGSLEDLSQDDANAAYVAQRVLRGDTGLTPVLRGWFDMYNIPERYIDLQMYQRSGDMFLGVPFNIASYALLLMMVAKDLNMIPHEYVHTIGDAHVYSNHIKQANKQLSRHKELYDFPHVILSKAFSLLDTPADAIELHGYKHHPFIRAPISV